jgi:hypothetical protein
MFMKISEMNLNEKYCEANQKSNLHIGIVTYNPRKVPNNSSTYAKIALTALVTQ